MPTKPAVKLSKEATAWISEMQAGWEYAPGEREILMVAAAAWDRWREAKVQIDRDGAVVRDRFDQLKLHPAHIVERDSRSAFLVAMARLHFEEVGPPAEVLQLPKRRRSA